jgi:uncharacterized metal-binding protein YceD (DUF177 family)
MSSHGPIWRPIYVASLSRHGARMMIDPTTAELEALAALLDLPSVELFHAEVSIMPVRSGEFHVTGNVGASVHQTCVVSLEPFPVAVSETIDVRLASPDNVGSFGRKEIERTLSDADPPDVIEDGVIDVGALAVEALALGLHPFPRKPGIAMPEEPKEAAESPFAALAALKKPQAE